MFLAVVRIRSSEFILRAPIINSLFPRYSQLVAVTVTSACMTPLQYTRYFQPSLLISSAWLPISCYSGSIKVFYLIICLFSSSRGHGQGQQKEIKRLIKVLVPEQSNALVKVSRVGIPLLYSYVIEVIEDSYEHKTISKWGKLQEADRLIRGSLYVNTSAYFHLSSSSIN